MMELLPDPSVASVAVSCFFSGYILGRFSVVQSRELWERFLHGRR